MRSKSPSERVAFLILVGVSVVAIIGLSRVTRPRERVVWQTDLAAARREARATGKHVLVDFTAVWCGPCESMRGTTWSDGHVAAAIARDYVPVRIDIDQQRAVARAYDVTAIPRLVVESADGTVARSTVGAIDADGLLDWLGPPPAETAVPVGR